MTTRIYTVDAFTTTRFAGNPAGVCPLAAPASEAWMQAVARELNLSETAFFYPVEDGYHLRWFTPIVEVNLCGHATLSSAHVLFESGQASLDSTIHFHTRSGLLSAAYKDGWISLDFPARLLVPTPDVAALAAALGVEPTYTGKNVDDYLIEVSSEKTVREVQPNFSMLKSLPARGVIVTSRASTPGYDFVSRFFAPAVGIDEDPVTGSSHCCLGPYWANKLGKTDLSAYQASARGGSMRVEVKGERVDLWGQAITMLRAEMEA
jgi:PhzF family phenazine biosynthesis protein